MSLYSTYNTELEYAISNESEAFFETDKKVKACNDVISELLEEYDIYEMQKKATITFDSYGIASRPSDYFKMVKLWSSQSEGAITAFADAGGGQVTVTSAAHGLSNSDVVEITGTTSYDGIYTISNKATDTFEITATWVADDATGDWTYGQELNEYEWTDPHDFDNLSDTASYWMTEDYIASASTRKLKVKPVSSGILNLRYLKVPGVVDSTDTTDSGLSSRWDKVVAAGMAKKLFEWAARYDEIPYLDRQYNKLKKTTWLSVKDRGGWRQQNKFRSIYSRSSILNR